ncbi:prospero homeobox protein 1-like [Entelurus aequoreus]|uniref:prospero homeobox protein 1-like n=1 Tax=Entelurus aequoreus TaxID=161455 RepID=UPI002B1DA06F|nr:prospero homeobox protein 1-like [Entelurus aequoreus]
MWSKNLCSSIDDCTAQQHFESGSEVPDVLNPLGQVGEKSRKLLESLYYGSRDGSEEHPCTPEAKWDWSGRQAKRARVENIIRGMTPGDRIADVAMKDGREETSGTQGQEMMKELRSQMRQRAGDMVKESLAKCENRPREWKTPKMDAFSSKLMADVLKYELSRAVSRSVDSIFKSMPLPQKEDGAEFIAHPCKEELQVQDVQTEALSLVLQRPQMEGSAVHQLSLDSGPLVLNYCNALGPCSETKSRRATFDPPWNSVTVRSKVNSRSSRSPTGHMSAVLDNLCLPYVKGESGRKNNLYILSEGLTTNHLKKAKLMFFYTRYPSSTVLKTCFRDVQLTRCITSQLIKWFSNFREFYYIQMEKFARHAVTGGPADDRALSVGRESELFRALNMHYNKGNDFQVPDRFLEVAAITLRQFYIAISTGKDRDPSWKKAIYKVICKLDTDIPAEFMSYE